MVEGTTAELQRHSFLEAPLLEIEKAAITVESHAGDTPALHLVIKHRSRQCTSAPLPTKKHTCFARENDSAKLRRNRIQPGKPRTKPARYLVIETFHSFTELTENNSSAGLQAFLVSLVLMQLVLFCMHWVGNHTIQWKTLLCYNLYLVSCW